MEPKLKAFLSSAQFHNEFIAEREGLPAIFEKQPLAAAFVLWRIEDYASPEETEAHYSKHIDDSDLFVLLLGTTFREAVKKEFRRAIEKQIPVFAFVKQPGERDSDMTRFIEEVSKATTYARYTSFIELVKKLEDSLLQYYYRGSRNPKVLQWRAERPKRRQPDEERSLRLLAGVLVSDAASATKTRVVEVVLLEAVRALQGAADQNSIISKAMTIIRSDCSSTRVELATGLTLLMKKGIIRPINENKFVLAPSEKDKTTKERADWIEAENRLFTRLHDQHRELLGNIDLRTYQRIVADIIAQVVYDTAVDMADQEFGCGSSPFPYNADEINRVVADALSNAPDLPQERIGAWQSAIVSVLQSEDESVFTWLNRLRKAYWALSVLGMDPNAIEYKAAHLRNYCIYLDSHIVLRAMVNAGGGSTMCAQILRFGRKMGVEMRLSPAMFKEVDQALSSANKTFYAANGDILRASRLFEAIQRKSDIFEGYLLAKARTAGLSWDNFMNQFYSPSGQTKLENYLGNELGVVVQSEQSFSVEQLGRIEDIAQRLLQKRRQVARPPEGFEGKPRAEWERQYLLRTNEARQMAIIYELRQKREADKKQYWFVTFDEFVYEVSAALVADESGIYEFPCYMKPATWLEIISNASPDPLPINTFREVLLSRDIQQVADQLEAEVISQMLKSRVDQDVENIESLRHMFADIVNRPAVQEAYQKVLEAEGINKLAATDKVKDEIIAGMKELLTKTREDLKKTGEEVIAERRKTKKAVGKARYLKQQLGRLTSRKRKKDADK